MKKNFVIILLIGSLIGIARSACACTVPVFRYSLERWPADPYGVFVLHTGNLSPEDNAVVEWLEKKSISTIGYSNYAVETVNMETDTLSGFMSIWRELGSPKLPRIMVKYAGNTGINRIVLHERLSMEAARAVVESPVRNEAAERIMNGDAGVWILLESGDKEADDAAADSLKFYLEKMDNSLLYPEQMQIITGEGQINIRFSMIRFSRSDEKETAFIRMLINSEPDLSEYLSLPMAFPLYGRGRILYALVGKGINRMNIRQACSFLVGPCSCLFKAQNPGIDLLIPVDWDAHLDASWIPAVELPPLTGFSGLIENTVDDNSSVQPDLTENTGKMTEPGHGILTTDENIAADAGSIGAGTETARELGEPASPLPRADETKLQNASIASSNILRNIFIILGMMIIAVSLLSLKIVFGKSGNKS